MSLLSKLLKITTKQKKRIGRGHGSGKGSHTASRGTKGQKSRVGSKVPLWFEGGQLPLVKRLPMMRGKGRFNVLNPAAELSLSDLNKLQGDTVSLDSLKLEKVIDRRFKKAKIVATGTLSRPITVTGVKVSKAARQAIEKAGGTVN